jgi:hypothetical protein
MATTLMITESGIRVLDKDGWRAPVNGEVIPTGDGNYLQVNGEDSAVAFMKGVGIAVVVMMAVVGVCAAAFA